MTGTSRPSSSKHLPAAVLVLIAAALFGASAPLSKLLLGSFDAVVLAAFLYLGSGFGAGIMLILKRKRQANQEQPMEARITRADVPWLAGAVAAGGVIAPILMMLGLSQTPASTASLLLNFEGVATGLLAAFLFKEAVGKRIILAMGLITLAAIVFSWTGGNWGVSVGALAILSACLFWGLDNNLTRHISAKDPLVIVGAKGLGAGSFSLVLALALGRPLPALGSAILALAVGAVCYGVSIQLFILGLRSLGAARTSTLYGVAPFLGALLSFALLRESPTILFWVGLPLMLAGAALMLSERHQHIHTHPVLVHTHPHTHDDGHHRHEHAPGDVVAPGVSHTHSHTHPELTHEHEHTPDLHHWHSH